jgi:hypothetical protein
MKNYNKRMGKNWKKNYSLKIGMKRKLTKVNENNLLDKIF